MRTALRLRVLQHALLALRQRQISKLACRPRTVGIPQHQAIALSLQRCLHLRQRRDKRLRYVKLRRCVKRRAEKVVARRIDGVNFHACQRSCIDKTRLLACGERLRHNSLRCLFTQLRPVLSRFFRQTIGLRPFAHALPHKIAAVGVAAHAAGNAIAICIAFKAHIGLRIAHRPGLDKRIGIEMHLRQRIDIRSGKGIVLCLKAVEQL